jgi:hypothetical protein
MSEARAQPREQKRRTGVRSPFRIARRGMSQSGNTSARIFRIETIGRKVAIASVNVSGGRCAGEEASGILMTGWGALDPRACSAPARWGRQHFERH